MTSLYESYDSSLLIVKTQVVNVPLILLNNDKTVNEIIGKHPHCYFPVHNIHIHALAEKYIENGCLLYFNQENVSHALSQFLHSYYYIVKKDPQPKIYVNQSVLNMPFILKLLNLLFTDIVILEDLVIYKCNNILFYVIYTYIMRIKIIFIYIHI